MRPRPRVSVGAVARWLVLGLLGGIGGLMAMLLFLHRRPAYTETDLSAIVLFLAGIASIATGIVLMARKQQNWPAVSLSYKDKTVHLPLGLFAIIAGIGIFMYLHWSGRGRSATSGMAWIARARSTAEEYVPDDYVEYGEPYTPTKPKYVTPAEWCLYRGRRAYGWGDFEKATRILDSVDTENPHIAGLADFYECMCNFRILYYRKRHFLGIDSAELAQLSARWSRFEETHQRHRSLPDAIYWRAQTEMYLRGNDSTALGLFERVIDKYPYSTWVEGALYYSSLILHGSNDTKSRQEAVRRMKSLRLERNDEWLRLVEVWEDVYAGPRADEIMTAWGLSDSARDDGE